MTHRLHPNHRKQNTRAALDATRFRSRLCMALSAALLLPAVDAAAEQFEYIGVQVPAAASYNLYTANIYEWRYANGVARSLPPHCNATTAPIVVLFHGGTGVDVNNATLNSQMTKLAPRLARACVRMVAIQGITPMNGGAPKSTYVRDNTTFTAYNMYRALDIAMKTYPSTTNVVLFSGSFGGVTSTALMYNYFYNYTGDSDANWKKLDRFVLSVPAGNVYDTCTPQKTAISFPPGFTSFANCEAMIGHVNSYWQPYGWSSATAFGKALGSTATPFSAAQIATFKSKAQLHLLVGSADDIVAPYTGPQGTENYLGNSNLGPHTTRLTDALPPASSRITFITITGAGHSNLWDYNANVTAGVCQLMARRFDERDSRQAGIESNCN